VSKYHFPFTPSWRTDLPNRVKGCVGRSDSLSARLIDGEKQTGYRHGGAPYVARMQKVCAWITVILFSSYSSCFVTQGRNKRKSHGKKSTPKTTKD